LPQNTTWKQYKVAGPNADNLTYTRDNHSPFKSNEADAAANIDHFRAIVGLIKAIKTGLTPQQISHIQGVLQKNRLTPEQAAALKGHLGKITESLNAKREDEAVKLMKAAESQYKPGTLERKYFMAELARLDGVDIPEDVLPALSKRQSLGADQFLKRFRGAVKLAIDRHPQFSKNLKLLSKNVEKRLSPKEPFPGFHVLEELIHYELSVGQSEELLSIFKRDEGVSDSILNDVLNAHPVAAKLLGDRLDIFVNDYMGYTEHYYEGAETIFPDVTSDPDYMMGWKKDAHFQSPTPNHPPYNSPLEEVYQWKLERLAQILNIDLSTPVGLSQFEIFTHTYDLSPGEPTLDRVHSYPPWYHTYEELPIIKFDGYDPLDVEGTTQKGVLKVTNKEVQEFSKILK